MAVVLPLLLLALLAACPIVFLAAAADGEDGYTVVALSTLKPNGGVCFGHRVNPPQNSTWIPLSLMYGPCSGSDTATPSMAELLRQDQLRVDDIQIRLSGDVSDQKKHPVKGYETKLTRNVKAPVNIGNANKKPGGATTTLSITDPAANGGGGGGRSNLPGVVQTVVLDTASDVPWVQCVSCPVPPCHPETDTVFDPTMSPSYAAVPCNSPACTRLGPYANGCINNQCQYRVVSFPPDGSSASGTYSTDLLTLDAANSVRSFQFGCTHSEQGSASFDNTTAGIMALGGGPESLVSQTASKYGNVFSYCVPPTETHSGFFVLGVPAVDSSRYALTPLLSSSSPPQVPVTFYRVLLRAITVNGQALSGVPPAVFAPGTVLDSRTALTRLPPTAYQALRAAFRNAMAMYRQAPPQGNLDTCYDFTGVVNVRLPRIALVFDRNAVVELDPSGILLNSCLAFIPNPAGDTLPSILGNVQQQTIEVLYNIRAGLVGFRRGAC